MTVADKEKMMPQNSEQVHRRETFRDIVAPLLLGVMGLIFSLLLTFTLPMLVRTPEQVAMLANTLAIIYLICPMILCILPAYILLMIIAFGTGRLHSRLARPLHGLNRFSRTVTDKTIEATEAIGKHTINARVKIAGLENAMNNAFKGEDVETHDTTDETDESRK